MAAQSTRTRVAVNGYGAIGKRVGEGMRALTGTERSAQAPSERTDAALGVGAGHV